MSEKIVYEARFEFQLGSPITQFTPTSSSTQFIRPISTEGESRGAFLLNHQYQFADTLSLIYGRHSIKLGGDVEFSSSSGNGQEFGTGFVLGQFRFKNNAATNNPNIPTSALSRLKQQFSNQRIKYAKNFSGNSKIERKLYEFKII